jgi:2-C-methyl-D-erythritol 4-phosphate cytidylyltransferase
LFQAVLAGAAQTGAASLYVPLDIHDALATTAPDGSIESILPRSRVVRLQTPHAYRREVLADAHRRAEQAGIKEDGTAAIVKWAGYGVQLISGSAENIKITYPPDLEAAAAPSLRP